MSNESCIVTEPAVLAHAGRRRRISLWPKWVVGLIVAGVILFFVILALMGNLRKVDWSQVNVRTGWLILAALSVVAARWLNAFGLHLALRSLGSDISQQRVLPIVWSSWLARYIPGKVMATAGAAALLAREGVRLPTSLAAMSLSVGVTSVLSVMFCMPLLMGSSLGHLVPGGWAVCLVVIAGGVLCLHPSIFIGVWNRVLRCLKRQPIASQVAMRPFGAFILVSVARCLVAGLWLWLVARAVRPIGMEQYGWVLGCSSLASVGTVLAVGVPAGLGVREAIYLVAMESILGPEVGLVVIVNRLVQTVVDLATGAIGLVLLKRQHG